MRMIIVAAVAAGLLGLGLAQADKGGHPELGDVDWERDFDQALAKAQQSNKPVMALFQEVPGCAGCVAFGQETLRDPLIVDAAEQSFVPVAIFNNVHGPDREILNRYQEPAWNYQVIRFLNPVGEDIIPRRDRIWTPHGVATRMVRALETADAPVPNYLRTAAWVEQPGAITAAFGMFCFWEGEAKLGAIPGVLETEAGWLDGREVVKLRYDPDQVEWSHLVIQASKYGCAQRIYAPNDDAMKAVPHALKSDTMPFDAAAYRRASESDQKRQLGSSLFKRINLNNSQLTKINAAVGRRDTTEAISWLSPSQRAELRELQGVR